MAAEKVLDPSGSIRALTARGLGLTVGSQAMRVLLSIVSTTVLARLLSPDDFGSLAMVGPVMAFVVIVQDIGLQQASIQRRELSPGTDGARRRGNRMFALIAGSAGCLTLLSWDWTSPNDMMTAVADMTLRNDNHPI